MMLSRGAHTTVKAGPHTDMSGSIGLIAESSAPRRPWASWIVAGENFRSWSTRTGSGRSTCRLTGMVRLSVAGSCGGRCSNEVGSAEFGECLPDAPAGLLQGLLGGREGNTEVRG